MDKTRQKWVARIEFQGKYYFLGRYDELSDAAKIRKIAEKQIFGNFLEWYAENYPDLWAKKTKSKRIANHNEKMNLLFIGKTHKI